MGRERQKTLNVGDVHPIERTKSQDREIRGRGRGYDSILFGVGRL